MKNSRISHKWLLWILPFAMAFSSCYFLSDIVFSRTEVEPGGELTFTAYFIASGSEQLRSYGCFGVCLPEGWEAKDVVLHSKGHTNLTHTPMKESDIYTDIMNYRYSYVKENEPETWRWVGFATSEKVEMCQHHNSEESGGDSYVYLTATIIAGDTEGDYKLEFLMGDEQNGFEQYVGNMNHDPNNPTRLFNTGTFKVDPSKEDQEGKHGTTPSVRNPVTYPKTTIIVTKNAKNIQNANIDTIESNKDGFQIAGGNGCISVIAEYANAVASVYDSAGHLIDSQNVIGGEAQLNAPKGVCIVKVNADGRTLTKKVFVK